MEKVGYYNGEIGQLDEMKIPMLDRALFFGDGVYEVTTAYNHKMVAMKDHLWRFYNSLELMEMDFHLTPEELVEELQKCVDQADSTGPLMVYWQSTRGNCTRNHVFPDKSEKTTLLVTVTPLKPIDYSKKVGLIVVDDTRFAHCNIKTLNLIPNVIASQRAKEAGCEEAIFVRDGFVKECAHSSLMIIKDGAVIAPPKNEYILPSLSRQHLEEVCEELGVPCIAKEITLDEVMDADSIMVLSASKVCIEASVIEGKEVGLKNPDLFLKLQRACMDKMEQEIGEVIF